jgi:hypothetical protein
MLVVLMKMEGLNAKLYRIGQKIDRSTLTASLPKDDHSFFKNVGVVMLEWLTKLMNKYAN